MTLLRPFAALFAAYLLAVPAAAQAPPAALPPELNLVPRDGFLFVSARVGDLWNSDLVRAARIFVPAREMQPLTDFEKALGLTLADFERGTLILPSIDLSENGPVVVLTATKPYDRAKVVQALAAGGAEEKHQGRVYHLTPKSPLGALHLLNDHTVILGRVADVEAVLGWKAKSAAAPLAEALALATQKHHVVVGVNGAFMRQSVPANMPLEAQRFLPLMAMTHAAVTANVTKEGVQSTIRMSFLGENQARTGEGAVKDLLALLREGLTYAVNEFASDIKDNPAVKEGLRRVDAWLAGIPVRLDGTVVVVAPGMKAEDLPVVMGLLVPAAQKVREAATRVRSLEPKSPDKP